MVLINLLKLEPVHVLSTRGSYLKAQVVLMFTFMFV